MSGPRIAFVAPDAADAAVRRRHEGLAAAGASVTTFAFERGTGTLPPGFRSLGPMADGNMKRRVAGLPGVVWRLGADPAFRAADILYVRNLDLALAAYTAASLRRLRARRVYEVLDIHPMLSRADRIGSAMRRAERRILRRSDLLVVSSPRFIGEHLGPLIGQHPVPHALLENKLPAQALPAIAPFRGRPLRGDPPLLIGYFGKLRCQHSLALLAELAQARPDTIRIRLAGMGEPQVLDELARLRALPNVEFLGPYRYPDDLPKLYDGIHLNWCLDIAGGFNGRILLPNRLYEGGAFGVPALAERGTETGDQVDRRGLGLTIAAPYRDDLLALADGGALARLPGLAAAIGRLPEREFFDIDDHQRLLERILSAGAQDGAQP